MLVRWFSRSVLSHTWNTRHSFLSLVYNQHLPICSSILIRYLINSNCSRKLHSMRSLRTFSSWELSAIFFHCFLGKNSEGIRITAYWTTDRSRYIAKSSSFMPNLHVLTWSSRVVPEYGICHDVGLEKTFPIVPTVHYFIFAINCQLF
jgi:ABC-type polysaccharide transport system permease subunit